MIYANKANRIITSITPGESQRYKEYWADLTPYSDEQRYRRWLFSFMSVHTTWQANIKAYNLLKDRAWESDRSRLKELMAVSGVGLDTMRIEALWTFKQRFWELPSWWSRYGMESWSDARDRMVEQCYGLGYAKTSFALEMCFPLDCQVVCLDTHILQVYGVGGSAPAPKMYKRIEAHWVNLCGEHGVLPTIARNVYWDRVQKQDSPEYWASVLREPRLIEIAPVQEKANIELDFEELEPVQEKEEVC